MKNNNLTFTITITGTENSEWQGTLVTPEGTPLPFRSVLEMLREMDDGISRRD
jgi:hypothetical protein